MYLLVFFALFCVVVIKYYAAAGMRRLNLRLASVRDDLHRVKRKLQAAQDKRDGVQAEEDLHQERLRNMEELIQDLRIRLTLKVDRRLE